MYQAQTVLDLTRRQISERPNEPAYTYLNDPADFSSATTLTHREIDHAARVIASRLRGYLSRGERALLLYPPGLDYIVAIFACFYAGVIAVPAYPPVERGGPERVEAIRRDAEATIVLAPSELKSHLAEFLTNEQTGGPLLVTTEPCADALTAALPSDSGSPIVPGPGDLALIQYTSGSTATPRGVMLTHTNLLQNQRLLMKAGGLNETSVVVSWLPLYHDMGLMGAALQGACTGAHVILMSPLDFVKQPITWLSAITQFRATHSAAPNFAYDLCARRSTYEQRAGLNLSSWRVAGNGAEPIRLDTVKHFADTFAPCGFVAEAMCPGYGLAEATLFVSGGPPGGGARTLHVDAEALAKHTVVVTPTAAPASRPLVASGRVWPEQSVAIVDVASARPCPPSLVGEIWVAGGNVALGYWGQPQESSAIFHAQLPNDSRNYLRTGDLGFLHNGDLFVTGRIKDVIIIGGRNLYPQDIEATVESCHPAIRRGGVAALSIPGRDEEEYLAVVAELGQAWEDHLAVSSDAAKEGAVVVRAVRDEITTRHGVWASRVILVRRGVLPKTSSGKIRRRESRRRLLDGELESIPVENFADGLEALSSLRSILVAEFAAVLRSDTHLVNTSQPLSLFGLDSLMAVEVNNRIGKLTGTTLPFEQLLSGQSINDLTASILKTVTADEDGHGAKVTKSESRPRTGPGQGRPDEVLDEIESMSAGEVMFLLEHLAKEEEGK